METVLVNGVWCYRFKDEMKKLTKKEKLTLLLGLVNTRLMKAPGHQGLRESRIKLQSALIKEA